MPPRKPRVSVELRLPGITIGTNDVQALFSRGRDAGPFLIIARQSGLALDTGFSAVPGKPLLYGAHGRRHQLWYLRATGHRDEAMIVSADSGLALDGTHDPHDGQVVLLEEPHGETRQRWALSQAPDGVGYLIACVSGSRVLDVGQTPEEGWNPWLWGNHGAWWQQWILAMPHGKVLI